MLKLKNINKIAKKVGIKNCNLYPVGHYIAKVENNKGKRNGNLILVTAMTSNKTGIGKTTVSIGLADALTKLGKRSMLALREPSLGPVFGIKGGATGGGRSRVEPSDDINLHFTGDFHAIAQAANLLVSVLDNHIFQDNELKVDTTRIYIKRCLDVNERSLREIKYTIRGNEIKTDFVITAASEIMAIVCLSSSLEALKENLGNILVAMSVEDKPIFARDLQVVDAMALLLTNALKPNLVQTLEGTPALIHLGPFANIAHGCNSVAATNFALSHADYCITEAGFGSDLGAEKFLDIKTRVLNKTPDACVLVIVNNVIKEHGNGDLELGFENVKTHIKNLTQQFNLKTVVAINRRDTDSDEDIQHLINLCKNEGVPVTVSEGFSRGGTGCIDLAKLVLNELNKPKQQMNYTYNLDDSIKEKIEKIVTKIYHAGKVNYSTLAEEKIKLATKLRFNNFFVNIAKTQFSFSDDKSLLGAPTGFEFNITDIEIRSGAKMIVAIAGNMLLMPGLGKQSNYLNMKIDSNGKISGLF